MTTTVIQGEYPEVEALITRRRERGLDGHDELWNGVYHVVPHAGLRHGLVQAELAFHLRPLAQPIGLFVSVEFNLGVPRDFRVPDLGLHRGRPDAVYVPTAAMVIEVLSPDDKALEKFDFYASGEVDEIMVADPDQHSIRMWILDAPGGTYRESSNSALLRMSVDQLTNMITWP